MSQKKREPAKAGFTTVYWLQEEEEGLESGGSPVQVPLDFLSGLKGDLIRLKGFEIKVRGTAVCYYRKSDVTPGDYVFVARTLSPQQSRMVYG